MLQTFTFLSGGRQIDAKATFFRYESGSANGADEAIRVRADGNDLGLYYPGDAVELPIEAKRWEVVPVSAATVGSVRLGMGRVQSARLVGNVRVIDQSIDKTASGNQFWGGSANPADPANQSVISIRLGAAMQAAGKRVAVKAIIMQSPAAGDFMINVGSASGTATNAGTSGYNKLAKGAASGALVCAGVAVASSLLAAGEMAGAEPIGGRIPMLAATPFVYRFDSPVLLTGTTVLAILGVVANRQIGAVFDWEEV